MSAIDLLDGRWYASQPFDDWACMREEPKRCRRPSPPRTTIVSGPEAMPVAFTPA